MEVGLTGQPRRQFPEVPVTRNDRATIRAALQRRNRAQPAAGNVHQDIVDPLQLTPARVLLWPAAEAPLTFDGRQAPERCAAKSTGSAQGLQLAN